MRVINQSLQTITDYDLTAGKLIPARAIKEGAEPIDGVVKTAWADDDWEDVQMYVLDREPEETKLTQEERITALEAQLAAYEAAYVEGVNEA